MRYWISDSIKKTAFAARVATSCIYIYIIRIYICRYTGHASALQPPVRRSIRRNYTLMSTLNYRRRALYRIYGGYRRWRRGERNENKYHPLELGEGKRVIAMNFNQSGQRALI